MINSIKNSPVFGAGRFQGTTHERAESALETIAKIDDDYSMCRDFDDAWESIGKEKTKGMYELSAERQKSGKSILYVGHVMKNNRPVYSTKPMSPHPYFKDEYSFPELNEGFAAARALIEYDETKRSYNRYLGNDKSFVEASYHIDNSLEGLNYMGDFANSFKIDKPTEQEEELIANIKTSTSELKAGFKNLEQNVNSLRDVLSERTKKETATKNNGLDVQG